VNFQNAGRLCAHLLEGLISPMLQPVFPRWLVALPVVRRCFDEKTVRVGQALFLGRGVGDWKI
jgi:hypothetical protein